MDRNASDDARSRTKVAILGGGLGALSAAWQLVRLDPDRYDITVYQRGWRLGGKGASGRNLKPGMGHRIEEHGLHILMGFYDNVFEILKTCYDELAQVRPDPAWHDVGPWKEALVGADSVHVCDRYRNGDCLFWEICLPGNPAELPGERTSRTEPDIGRWLQKGFAFLYEALRHPGEEPGSEPTCQHILALERLRPLQRLGELLTADDSDRHRLRSELLCQAAKLGIRWAVSRLFHRLGDAERRDLTTIANRRQAMTSYFIGANLFGIIDNRLWCKQKFIDAGPRLDELDYREWLRRNMGRVGEAWPELAWNSPLINAIYDLIFSRQSGFGAGSGLYDSLSMLFNYWGHVYYRMNGGMGDVVFAPLYLWLRQRGVRFRFFERVRAIRPAPGDPRSIGEIVIEEQLDLAGHEYDPLIPVKGRPCWPSEPLLDRLPTKERCHLAASAYDLENSPATFGRLKRLVVGREFDSVVLGIPVGALQHEPELVSELVGASPRLAEMIQGLRTIRTQAMQIWLDTPPAALGWRGRQAMLGSYEGPFTSWGDMAQVLPKENWMQETVSGVEYFCDIYDGPDEEAHEAVRQDGINWLDGAAARLMPGWSWNRLVAQSGQGPERFDGQYWRANTSPSDRYVLAVPGTSRLRLPPDGSGFHNLFLAGDWVKTDLNVGCAEAAAMAGVGAGRAVHIYATSRVSLHPDRSPAFRQPAYLDRDSDWVLRHPVRLRGAGTLALALRADPDALAAFCSAQVDELTGGSATARPWPPRAGVVFLVCSDLPRVESEDREHGALGYFPERDVGFFIPVELRTNRGIRAIVLSCAYMFVDSALGLMAGREIFGFPKVLAQIEMPGLARMENTGECPRISVSSDVLVSSGESPPAALRRSTIVEVEFNGVHRAATPVPYGWGPLSRTLGRVLLGGSSRAARHLERLEISILSLKQIRDATLPRTACHQSLLLCRAQADRLERFDSIRRGYTVRLPHYEKPNIATALGLPSESVTTLGFQMVCDLHLPAAVPIWPCLPSAGARFHAHERGDELQQNDHAERAPRSFFESRTLPMDLAPCPHLR